MQFSQEALGAYFTIVGAAVAYAYGLGVPLHPQTFMDSVKMFRTDLTEQLETLTLRDEEQLDALLAMFHAAVLAASDHISEYLP